LNESGTLLTRFSYDAFGKRRNGSLWSGAPTPADWLQINSVTHRGFTGHEMLDAVGLIHMNGRVYDPQVGRFISADPFIQSPLNSQSLNRYSYVGNNPLNATDPSGYFSFKKFFKARLKLHLAPSLKHLFQAVRTSPGQEQIDDYIMTHKWAYNLGFAVATAATYWGYGFGGAVWASYYSYQATGSMTAAVTTLVIVAAMNYAIGQVTGAAGGEGGGAWGPNNGIAGPMGLTMTHTAEALEAKLAPGVFDQMLAWFGVATTSAELQARAHINRVTLEHALTWSRANNTIEFKNYKYYDFWAVEIRKGVYGYCDGEDPTCGGRGDMIRAHTDVSTGFVSIFRGTVTPGELRGQWKRGDRHGMAPDDQNVAELSAYEHMVWVLAHENWHKVHEMEYATRPEIDTEWYANAAAYRAVEVYRSRLRQRR
jgi:RHS repeat-associated protein